MEGERPGWKIAAAAKGAFDLKLKRALLEEQGLPTFVVSDFANELYGLSHAPFVARKGPDPFSIMVPEEALEEARAILAASAETAADEGAFIVYLDWRHRALTADGEFPRDYADLGVDDFEFLGESGPAEGPWRFFRSEKGAEEFELAFPRRFEPLAPLLRGVPGLQEAYSALVLSGYAAPRPIYEVFGFCDEKRMATKLGKLVLAEKKTGTSSLLRGYEEEGVDPPSPGDVSIVVDGRGRPLCAIETEHVDVLPFGEVGPDHARAEGEGDLSLGHWRKAHREFFGASWKGEKPFTEAEPVVCERFRVLKRFD